MSKGRYWKWISHNGQYLDKIGVNADGTLYNPNGYPEATVRAAIAAAEERRRARRSAGAAKAAETRRRRKERRIYDTAKRIADEGSQGPADQCVICGRGLGDPESIHRGVGSECWQAVLDQLEQVLSPPIP